MTKRTNLTLSTFSVLWLLLAVPLAYASDDNDFNIYGNLTFFDNSILQLETNSGTLSIPLDNDFEVDDYEGVDILNYTNSNLLDQYVELKVECNNDVLYANEIEQQDFDDDYDLYGVLTAFNATSISIDGIAYGITDDFEFELDDDDYDYNYNDSITISLVNATLFNEIVEVEIEPEQGILLAEDMELAEIVLCPYQYVANISDIISLNDTSTVTIDTPIEIVLLDNHFELGNGSMDLDTMELTSPVESVNATVHNIGDIDVELQQEFEFTTKNGTGVTLINSNVPDVQVFIPESTKVLATDEWLKTIVPPTESSSTNDIIPSGYEVPNDVIMVGSHDSVLVFDKAVTISLQGVTGQMGYKLAGETTWHLISTCAGTYENPTEPIHPDECSISDGVDTKILTYHFTEFGSFEESAPPAESQVSPPPENNSANLSSQSSSKSYQKEGGGGPIQVERIKKWVQEDDKNIRFAINEFMAQGLIDKGPLPSEVPIWIKTTIGYWSEGGITDEELYAALDYLLDKKIIR